MADLREPSGTDSATRRTTSTLSSRAKRYGSQTSSRTWCSKASVGPCLSRGRPAHRTSAAWPMTTMCSRGCASISILDPHQTLLIPVVRRPIGQLDRICVHRIGLRRCSAPTLIELMEVVEGLDRSPVKDPTSVDPCRSMARRNSWRSCARTRRHRHAHRGHRRGVGGATWRPPAACSRSGSTRCLLQETGKVHGGQGTGWGPSPSWLKA